jgi:ribosomal protein L44E
VSIFKRWSTRGLHLTCPHCKKRAAPMIFRRGRYMLGEQQLRCDQCGQTNYVTLWRFEGVGNLEMPCDDTPSPQYATAITGQR